jgi:predicted nucleic acid-binding protein
VYDSLYVALAEREKWEFVTADDPLVKNCKQRFLYQTSITFP